jgi:hypothetical protein
MKLTPQEEDILNHMRSGRSITPLEALGVYSVFRLGARIFNIKAYLAEAKTGEVIATSQVSDSKGKRYARYRIAKVEPRETADRAIETAESEAEPYVPNFVIVDPLPRAMRRPLAAFALNPACVA